MEISLNCPNCGREIIVENENVIEIKVCPYCSKPWKMRESKKGKIGTESGEKIGNRKRKKAFAVASTVALVLTASIAGTIAIIASIVNNGDGTQTPPLEQGVTDYELDAATLEASLVYRSEGDEVWITGYKPNYDFGDFTFPSKINGAPVTVIDQGAFRECTSLTGISIPFGIKEIRNDAFSDCTSLERVDLGDCIQMIDIGVFRNCTSLESFDFPSNILHIPDDVLSGSGVRSVNISKSVVGIDPYAFSNCSFLETIEVDILNSHYRTVDGNLYMGNTLIQYAIGKEETQFSIPSWCNWVEGTPFNGSRLQSIHIPAAMTEIDGGIFLGCKNLTSVTVDERHEFLSVIDGDLYWQSAGSTGIRLFFAFSAQGKTSYAVKESVTSIGTNAFVNCTALKTVYIPDSVNTIGYAFSDCISLSDIYFGGDETAWETIHHYDTSSYFVLATRHYGETGLPMEEAYYALAA